MSADDEVSRDVERQLVAVETVRPDAALIDLDDEARISRLAVRKQQLDSELRRCGDDSQRDDLGLRARHARGGQEDGQESRRAGGRRVRRVIVKSRD